ncbi:hypothetical protein VE01_07067 [Pseudogymnoascus verrucosus]|uniref:Zn(2)-C6 fungal-type domain-containing protein n=1 Tax=Pseudogymnoascus verrucosus TaxID=342668 RepID=A0A1B8GDU0_9PEZI|nr:uncharacterized protein VE01_07067 [Pseudogymnoascus verrucosus]OBT94001.1 hypothetical protein VE01_07067 [Pseudogymnoascus verrucosus]
MASPDKERAAQVCSTCKARKKGCDKRLPNCGYCTKRDLVCKYDTTGSAKRDLSTPLSSMTAWSGEQYGPWINSPSPIPLLTQLCSLSSSSECNLNRILDFQVNFVLLSVSTTVHEVCERYFNGVHKWLPVLSDTLLQEAIARAQFAPSPPADFSLLILTMCLITIPEPAASLGHTPGNQVTTEALYMTVKMLFGQVQAIVPTSIRMVQASIIISAFEYACGRPVAAYISMGTCLKMADSIGLDKCINTSDNDPMSKLKAIEAWNVWWGVVILERIVLFEALDRSRQPSTEYPGPTAYLPLDLTPGQPFQPKPPNAKTFDTPQLSNINATHISTFGRQAQAMYLHNEVTRAARLPDSNESKLQELRCLDDTVQSFLTHIMEVHTWEQVTYCGVVASSIRSLFLLHQSILALIGSPSTDHAQAHIAQSSRLALDTASKMMVDVARSHRENLVNADLLPICCTYNLRVARKHIEGRSNYTGRKNSADDISALLAQEKVFHERWSCLRHHRS